MRSHNPPSFEFQRPRWHSFPFQIHVGPPPIHSPSGYSVLAGTLPRVYSFSGLSLLTSNRPVFGSDTICNGTSPPLADIALFRLPVWTSPQGFKTRLLKRGLHTLIKEASVSSPTDLGSHNLVYQLRACVRLIFVSV